jgi:hypothetical protein
MFEDENDMLEYVIAWQASSGDVVFITIEQEEMLTSAGIWIKNNYQKIGFKTPS